MRPVCFMFLLLSFTMPAATDPEPDAGIKHIVLCWLNSPGDPLQRKQVIRTSLELRSIPGVRSITAGTPVPGDRPIVDHSFDVGLVMDFGDEEALNAYIDHPEHVSRVKEVLQPLCARVLVYDIRY